MNEYEHDLQVAICEYLNGRGICFWAVPNGGKRHISVAKKLKAEGVKSGIPDISIVHEGMFYGLEVKRPKVGKSPKGVLSANQKERIQEIRDAGGEVAVVYSVADVIEALIDWRFCDEQQTKKNVLQDSSED